MKLENDMPNPKVMVIVCIALALAGMYLGLYVL